MELSESILQIREKERFSHLSMYSETSFKDTSSWIHRPVKTVMEHLPYLKQEEPLHILDLGCGIGRNSIPIARFFHDIKIQIDCIDILDTAIDKLRLFAEQEGLSDKIQGIIASIDELDIPKEYYDLILAVSALEHVNSTDVFLKKLTEIRNGIAPDGIVCLIINSAIQEKKLSADIEATPQFEVNLPTQDLEAILFQEFSGWNILKNTRKRQQYDIPREDGTYRLTTTVVTFVAQNQGAKAVRG